MSIPKNPAAPTVEQQESAAMAALDLASPSEAASELRAFHVQTHAQKQRPQIASTAPAPLSSALVVSHAALAGSVRAIVKFVSADAIARLSADDAGGLVLTATAEGSGATVRVPGANWSGDCITLPLAVLHQCLRYSDCEDLMIRDAGSQVIITAGNARHAVAPVKAEDGFEFEADDDTEPTASFGRGVLGMLLGRVCFAKGSRDDRPSWLLDCVRLVTHPRRVELHATDTFQFATAGAIAECSQYAEVLLPFATLSRWASGCFVADRTALTIYSDHVVLRADGVTAWAPVAVGEFPTCAGATILPPHAVTFPPELRSALALVSRDDREVRLVIRTGSLAIEAPAVTSQASVPHHDGPPCSIPIDGAKLWKAIRTYAGAGLRAVLHYEDATRPIVITAGESRCVQVPFLLRARDRGQQRQATV